MPRSNWRYVLAAAGLALAICASGVWVYHVDNPIEQRASAEAHNPPVYKKTPNLERIARSLEAIEKGQNSQENEDRARRELYAQEGSWRWAKWAAWIAGVQLVLSTIGIAFVVLSLRQGQAGLHATRRALGHARTANKIAREAANMQLRPYLAFVIESNEKRDHPVERGRVYEFPFKNYGNTPALNLKVWFESILVQRPIGDLNIVLKHPPYYGGSLAPGATGYDLVDAPDDLNFIADIAAGWVLVCRTRVEYDIPTGGSDAIDQYMVLSAEGLSTGSFTTLTDYERQRTESG